MKVLARRVQAPEQTARQRRRISPSGLEPLLLTHPISVDGRLVFKVKRDRAKDLSESQSLKFSHDGFG